jgi:hypothetical protein
MVDGWKPTEKYNHKIEFGNMFHLCDEWFSRYGNATTGNVSGQAEWKVQLLKYARSLAEKYPYNQDEIDKWYRVCMCQFPEYIKYWQSHPDMQARTPLLQEQTFDVPYRLPSGRVCRLRGKWDAVDLVGRGKDAVLVLHESKTKGDIDTENIVRQLTWDCQCCLYMCAIRSAQVEGMYGLEKYPPVSGIRYNVIRRPLSGGRGTITQKKGSKNVPAETRDEYFERVAEYIRQEPGHYFLRWDVPVTAEDIQRFKDKFLNPVLENLCCWWDVQCGLKLTPSEYEGLTKSLHWQTPFGLSSHLNDGGYSEYDSYLENGSTVGLRQVDTIFPELLEAV